MKRIAVPWFGGGLFGFAVLFAQTIGGRYETNFVDAWNWFAPHIVPTLGIIVSALIAAGQPKEEQRNVPRYLFRLAWFASWTYVLLLNLTILTIPFVLVSLEMEPLEWLRGANAFIGIFQGVVLGFIGFFYGRADSQRKKA